MRISDRGFWNTDSYDRHRWDESMCDALIKMAIKKDVKTAIDLGCGNGYYTKRLIDSGIFCVGYDGNPHTQQMTNGLCSTLDLSKPIELNQYDLVLSLEVGEHIPKEFEQIFIDNVCNCAENYIVMSWAIPGQSGTGHVNCRENSWVVEQMKSRNFSKTDDSNMLRKAVTNCDWFKNTILTFEKDVK